MEKGTMKKNHQVVMEIDTHRQLKALAGLKGLTMGECIQALLNFTKAHRHISDVEFQARFNDLLESELQSMGNEAGWGAGHPDVEIKSDGKADLTKLQEKIRRYENGEG